MYDGEGFVNLTTEDGLVFNGIRSIHRDGDGVMWFGTSRDGLSRYDGSHHAEGKGFRNFTIEDGLPANQIGDISRDADGRLWLATYGGVSKYDGKAFVTLTTEDGLADNEVLSIHNAPGGVLWFGTLGGGVSRYNGTGFQNFTMADGLTANDIYAIHRSANGILWFGTWGGGVSMYDGIAWTSLDMREGLAGNTVRGIHQDTDGTLWFGTDGGLTRYRRDATPPGVRIVSVKTEREYTHLAAIPPLTTGSRITIAYRAIDFKTVPEKRQYRIRINGLDSDWRKPTKTDMLDITFDEAGTYTFEVQAIDRALNYSEPASLTLSVVPPWYLNGWIAIPSVGGILALLGSSLFFGSRYYIQRRQMLQQERHAREALQAKNTQLQAANEDAEAAKKSAEAANRAKSTFLANMSHEIRTPMNAILGYAQILHRDPDLQPRQREAVDTIENSGDHLLKLINDVLDLSKIEAGSMELQETDFDLVALIDGMSAMFKIRCEQKGIDWRVESLGEERVLVHGDESKLRQVLINLLGNAIKFTESGGVRLQVVREATDSYHFEVIDTGVGIPPEAQATILEPFQQGQAGTSKGGTGLGLAISQRYIELMGGGLDLASEPGMGSRFFFTIPLPPMASDAIAEPSQWEHVTRLSDGYAVKALIADDTKINRDVLSKLLTDLGAEVLEAENGEQAVELVHAHRPDIVFMDIRMPQMDGIQAAQRIFEECGKDAVKLVAISASTLHHEQQSYLDAGFDDFISKPFRFERVCECLATHLGVQFETGEVGEVEEQPPMTPQVSLPDHFLTRMKTAAEGYRVTELETHLNEVEGLGTEGHRLAQRLRELIQNFDMDAVLRILSQLED